jgi:cyanophycinase
VVGPQYVERFRDLGVGEVVHVDLRSALDSIRPENIAAFEAAEVVFFSGGDQRRITACLLNTPLHGALRDLLARGGSVAGTSAGAMAVSRTMIAGGPGTGMHGKGKLELTAGLGLLAGAIVDSHFAQRGRWARLLSAVALSPGELGLGVDEDTAAVLEDGCLRVLGAGHVWLLDGAELRGVRGDVGDPLGIGSAWNARMAMMGEGDELELASGRLGRHELADAVGE